MVAETNIIIRQAHPEDAAGIARVHIASWQTSYRGIFSDEFLDSRSATLDRRTLFWERYIREAGADKAFFVAEIDAEIVGFASGGKPQEVVAGFDCELYAIYLLEDAQGKGIGKQLTQEFTRAMHERGYSSLIVWVLAANNARGFYEHLGGELITDGTYENDGQQLEKLAFGWHEITSLLGD